MNFVDFLKNNSVVSFNVSPSKNQSSDKLKQTKTNTNTSKKNITKETTQTTIKKEQNTTLEKPISHPFQKGDFVKIIKYKNSIYNYYKNYTAEIKEYNPFQNHVIVFLHPTHNFKLLQLHADHVVKN